MVAGTMGSSSSSKSTWAASISSASEFISSSFSPNFFFKRSPRTVPVRAFWRRKNSSLDSSASLSSKRLTDRPILRSSGMRLITLARRICPSCTTW